MVNVMSMISVIIPAYNVSNYIDKCIESVCLQTYQEIEVIIVDDGSTDNQTAKKCDEWALKDNRIKVIHKANGGLSDARNAGLDVAKGEFIYFLDGDDYIDAHLLECVMLEYAQNIDLVFFSYTVVDESGNPVHRPNLEYGVYHLGTEQEKLYFLIEKLLQHRVGWEAWNKIFRRDIIEKYHIRFEDNNRIFAEDQYFSICYCLHVSNVVSIPNRLYYYVQRDNSIMSHNRYKDNIGRISLLSQSVYNYIDCSLECNWAKQYYPILHWQIINNEFDKLKKNRNFTRREIREVILKSVKNSEFFFDNLKKLHFCRKSMFEIHGVERTEQILSEVQYYLKGNYMISRIRNRLILWCNPFFIRIDPHSRRLFKEYKMFVTQYNKRIYLIGTETFGNLGDHQIAESILVFLKTRLPEYGIKEIPLNAYESNKLCLKKFIQSQDVILLSGGGNIGDLYPLAEKIREDVIETWPHNRKISFPQTIYFSDSSKGRETLQKGKKIYTNKNNVVLFARDNYSYLFVKKNFNCDTFKCPDIVLSDNKEARLIRKNQVIFCIRQDVEKKISQQDIKRIMEFSRMHYETIIMQDTQLDYNLDIKMRYVTLSKVFELWQTSKLVVTDRLHGMVFAAITGTPCIAFDNFNNKVSGTYEWIKYLPYIKFVTNINEALKWTEFFSQGYAKYRYSNHELEEYFSKLEDCIKSSLENS